MDAIIRAIASDVFRPPLSSRHCLHTSPPPTHLVLVAQEHSDGEQPLAQPRLVHAHLNVWVDG